MKISVRIMAVSESICQGAWIDQEKDGLSGSASSFY